VLASLGLYFYEIKKKFSLKMVLVIEAIKYSTTLFTSKVVFYYFLFIIEAINNPFGIKNVTILVVKKIGITFATNM
jgi:hypothetical protein